jgi:hypothetical protein
MHGLVGAFEDAQTATHAMLIDHISLHFLRSRHFSHLDGGEVTSFYAGLTAFAFFLTDDGPVAAGRLVIREFIFSLRPSV